MEAATASGTALLSRDGAVPIAPAVHDSRAAEPIDGVARCACCHRYPLVGEQVVRHVAKGRKADGWACTDCEDAGRTGRLGPAVSATRVRTFGGALNVRRLV